MKRLLLMALMLLGSVCYGQVRLGYNKYAIMREFPDRPWQLDEKSLYFTNESVTMHYFFDEDNTCMFIGLGVLKPRLLNSYVEEYNREAVILDDYHWKYYGDNGTMIYITLRQVDGIMTFLYTFTPFKD
jgi:hypothetical protein